MQLLGMFLLGCASGYSACAIVTGRTIFGLDFWIIVLIAFLGVLFVS